MGLSLGNRIKMIRVAKGLTQEKLAERIGKSIGLIGQIERAEAMPSVDTLVDIICVLNVSADSVLCDAIPNQEYVSTQILKALTVLNEREQAYVLNFVREFRDFISIG